MTKWLAASAAGLFAFSALPASAATTSCSTVAACVFGSNTSSGIGAEGSSKSGSGVSGVSTSGHGVNGTSASSFGVVGITTENATSTGTARAGVLGEDASTNKKAFNSGVAGSSAYGYGGSFTSTNGVGLYASASDGTGVVGKGNEGGLFYGGSYGVFGSGTYGGEFEGSAEGVGIYANSYNIAATFDTTDGDNGAPKDTGPTLLLQSTTAPFLTAENSYSGEVASMDANGDLTLAGTLTQNGSPMVRTHSSIGADVASYGARSAAPTIEDFGSAILRNGIATVPLERTFASTIAPGYMVFVTPHGDSNSLYTQNAATGFIVRESKGGRSTVAFDYRIVARPRDASGARLALVTTLPHRLRGHIKRIVPPKIKTLTSNGGQ